MSLSLASTLTRASTGMLSLALISSLAVAGIACGSGSPTGADTGSGNNGNNGNNGNSAVSVHIVADAASKTSSAYSPNPVTVLLSSGGTVRWSNDDVGGGGGGGGGYGSGGGGTTHTVTENNGLFNASISPAGSFQHTFSSTGDYSYHCSIHPTMVGTVSVRP